MLTEVEGGRREKETGEGGEGDARDRDESNGEGSDGETENNGVQRESGGKNKRE